jgi:hypothetical protein
MASMGAEPRPPGDGLGEGPGGVAGRGPLPLPFLPPLDGVPELPLTAGAVLRLVTALGTIAVVAGLDHGEGIAVFRERVPVLAIARLGERTVSGPEALDAVAAAALDRTRLFEVGPELARLLGAWFLPTTVEELPATAVVPEVFLRSFARPGRQTCVIVQTEDDLGVAFLEGAGPAVAYRRWTGTVGGMEQLEPLLGRAEALLTVRSAAVARASEPAPATADALRGAPPPAAPPRSAPPPPTLPPAAPAPAAPDVAPSRRTPARSAPATGAPAPFPPASRPAAPGPAPRSVLAQGPGAAPPPSPGGRAAAPPPSAPVPRPGPPGPPDQEEGLEAFLAATAGQQAEAPPQPPPPGEASAHDAEAQVAGAPAGRRPELLEAVLAEVGTVLGRNVARVEDLLSRVEPTPDGLEAALLDLREHGVRLLSPAKLDQAIERALAVLRGRRGGPPQ